MRKITGVLAAGVGLAFVLTGHAAAQQNFVPNQFRGCSMGTLQGTYGIQISGMRPTMEGPIESVIGVAIRRYDGLGTFTQVGNVKGSLTGLAANQQGFGTYQVNDDCSASSVFTPGNGVQIVEQLVIVDDGNEIRSISGSPPPLMVTGVHKRISSR